VSKKAVPGTKTKILRSARELFSKLGYDGASVRQIAEDSGANIAAINYHFGNKHGLYWAIIDEAHIWLDNGIKESVEASRSVEDLSRNVFRMMRSGESYIRSTMKTYLTEGVPALEPEALRGLKSFGKNFGPPGGLYIHDFFRDLYGEAVSDEAILWATRSLLSSLIHWSTMCSSSTFREISQGTFSDETLEETIVHLSRSVAQYMCEEKNWSAS